MKQTSNFSLGSLCPSRVALCCLLLCVATLVSAAPIVAEGQSLVVLVTDDTGRPLPEALVIVRDDTGTGPTPAKTQEDGRVTFELESGEWQVDVQREGFMIYTGYVRLEAGKRPELGFSSRQRTGSYWAPLSVSFGGGGAEAVFAANKKEEKQARKAVERQQKDDDRSARQKNKGSLARVQDRESNQAKKIEKAEREKQLAEERRIAREGSEKEAADRKIEGGAAVDDVLQAQGASTSAEKSPAPRAQRRPGRNTATVVPRSSAQEAPSDSAQSAETVQSAGGELLRNPNLLPAGACRECREGEWAVSAFVTVAANASACSAAAPGVMADVAALIAARLPASSRRFAGQVQAQDGNDVLRLLSGSTKSELLAELATLGPETTSCPLIALVLPAGAKYVGFRYRASDGKSEGDCRGTDPCQVGEAEWLSNPKIEKTSNVTLVYAQFENQSKNQERVAELRVYFVPPDGWLPPN